MKNLLGTPSVTALSPITGTVAKIAANQFNPEFHMVAPCNQVSDNDLVLYCFNKLDFDQMERIKRLIESDILLTDARDAIIEMKEKGRSEKEILLSLEKYEVPSIDELRLALPNTCINCSAESK